MARVDEDREERDQEPLKLESILTCEECDVDFDHVFTADEGIFEREDLVDAPVEEVTCPNCGLSWEAEWGGWLAHEDAG